MVALVTWHVSFHCMFFSNSTDIKALRCSLRSKYLNEGNTLKRLVPADGNAASMPSSDTSTSPFAQDDARSPDGTSQPSGIFGLESASERSMAKAVSMWQGLHLDIPGTEEKPGEVSDRPQINEEGSAGGGLEGSESCGRRRIRRNSASLGGGVGGVSITRRRSGAGEEIETHCVNISAAFVNSTLVKPSDSYKESHPHAKQVMFSLEEECAE